ncbi:MAG: ABC transporter substrate-binding protein [Sporichthyaceae bacterium]
MRPSRAMLVVALVLALLGAVPATAAERREPLLLGGVFPLSGPTAAAGSAMLRGVQAVLAEVNEAGGVDGRQLELLVGDDRFDAARGADLIRRQIAQGVVAFAGVFSPHTVAAGLPLLRAAATPVFATAGAEDRDFANPMLFPVTSPCGHQMAGNVQHLVRDLGLTRLAVVSTEGFSACTEGLVGVAQALGATIAYSAATTTGAPDCLARVLVARAAGAQALLVNADNLGTVKCLQARLQLEWNVPASVSYLNTDDPTILRTLGPTADGLLSSSPFAGATSPQFDGQCGALAEYFPGAQPHFHSMVGCLSARLLVAALRAADADPTRLVEVLESGRTFSFGGLAPPIGFGPDRSRPYDATATVEVRAGNWVRTGPLYAPLHPPRESR